MTSYTERMHRKDAWLNNRAERREEWADKAEARSDAAYQASNRAVNGIEPGQPILFGHHSQRKHERALERAQKRMTKCVEETKLAKHHEGKAATLRFMAEKRDSPAFCTRRMEEAKTAIRKLERENRTDSKYYAEAQEKLAYWSARRDEVAPGFEETIKDAKAHRIAEISQAKWVFSHLYGWRELVKVNKMTVEVKSQFLAQPNFKYPIKFVYKWQNETPVP